MRRLTSLLCAAGLAVAPRVAVADPSPDVETFEWSTVTSRARLGVMVVGITPELRKHFGAADNRGVLVGRVEPKSAAEAAGLEVGDLIVEVHGRAIDTAGDVISALAPVKQGDTVPISVIRDRKPMTLQAKLTTAPSTSADAPRPRWLDDWFDDMRHRFDRPDRSAKQPRWPDWVEDLLRPWHDRGPDRTKGSTRT